MANNFIQPGHVMDYHNTGTTQVKSGAVVEFADGIGVAKVTIPGGEVGSVGVTGVWELPKKSGLELEQGASCNWVSGKVDTADGTSAGMVWEAAAAADNTVLVKIG